jgi:hypothetical protein
MTRRIHICETSDEESKPVKRVLLPRIPLVFPFMCLECGVSRGLIFISNSLQSIDEGGGEGFGSMALQSGWVAAVYEYPNDK